MLLEAGFETRTRQISVPRVFSYLESSFTVKHTVLPLEHTTEPSRFPGTTWNFPGSPGPFPGPHVPDRKSSRLPVEVAKHAVTNSWCCSVDHAALACFSTDPFSCFRVRGASSHLRVLERKDSGKQKAAGIIVK